MAHVFISYPRDSGNGHKWAARIHDRLQQERYTVWRDESALDAGDNLLPKIRSAVETCGCFLYVLAEASDSSGWMGNELQVACKLDKPVIAVQVEACEVPIQLESMLRLGFAEGIEVGLRKLVTEVSQHVAPRQTADEQRDETTGSRAPELAYLDELIHGSEMESGKITSFYTPLSGVERSEPSLLRDAPAAFMPQILALRPRETDRIEAVSGRTYDDILDVLRKPTRLALLGEPGAGKTFSLARALDDLAHRGLQDPKAPIPVFARLGKWTEKEQPLVEFLRGSMGPLGERFEALKSAGRLALLLDGLNETPTAERANKALQVADLIRDERIVTVLVTCRVKDFEGDLKLDLDTLTIEPMTPPKIGLFLERYLVHCDAAHGAERAERLFWEIAGGDAVREAHGSWERAGENTDAFWDLSVAPNESWEDDWRKEWIVPFREQALRDPRGLLRVAAIPFFLTMLVQAHLNSPSVVLPKNRAGVLKEFVDAVLVREKLATLDEEKTRVVLEPAGEALLRSLAALGWTMQTDVAQGGDENVLTALSLDAAKALLTDQQLDQARGASLIEIADELRFRHQLFQEYFAATELRGRIADQRVDAAELWPPATWWERSGWEEVTVFAAGLDAPRSEAVPDWLADPQPEVAADCIIKAGLTPSNPFLDSLHDRWLPRLTNVDSEPAPPARAAVGRALGLPLADGRSLDDRPGVGLNTRGLPDIYWQKVPEGPFTYQDGERRELPTFWIAAYAITNAQYQAFVDDGGYRDKGWWEGLARRFEEPEESRWPHLNQPRTNVSWYEAVAFCRWLSESLNYEVRLPTEEEWEKAARGEDGRVYPWGNEYRSGYANVDETENKDGPWYLERPTAVGMYPQNTSPYGVVDMAGNVWEWCRNEYENPERVQDEGAAHRVLRGGSWIRLPGLARASSRFHDHPDLRYYGFGFRVCCSSPIPDH